MTEPMLRGAYADLDELLALRLRPMIAHKRNPPVFNSPSGSRLTKLRGRGIDFSEVRAYQPGDDVRTIDWRVTARKNKPHTKLFREERERPTLVVVDQTQSMFFGSQVRLKSVAAAEIAAIAAWQALNHNDRVGGVILGNDDVAIHKPYRNVKAIARFLSDLARYNQSLSRSGPITPNTDMAERLTQVQRLAHTNYRIYFISDFEPMGTHWRNTLHAMSRHNQVIAVRVFDPLERDLPPSDRYTVSDGLSRWQFHAGNQHLRSTYHSRFEAHEAELKQLCGQVAIRYKAMATNEPVNIAGGWL